ncbi:unnamed protein product, partial [Adineta steineri]
PTVISTNFDKQPLMQQNQHISVHSAFQSTINDSVPITAWNLNDMHRPQTQMRSGTQPPPTPNIVPAFTSVFINKQPQQSPIHPSQQPLTINNMPSSAFSPNDIQRQQTQGLPLSRSSTYNFIPSPGSIATDDHSHGYFFPPSFTNNMTPTDTSMSFDDQQSQQMLTHSNLQAFNNNLGHSNTSVFVDKRPYQT